MKLITFNTNDPLQIKRAERLKTKYENLGYSLVNTSVNSVTGICVITYKYI
jgi:hypothetical protein